MAAAMNGMSQPPPTDLDSELDLGGIDGHLTRDECDLLEAVGSPQARLDGVVDDRGSDGLLDHRGILGRASKTPADGVNRRGHWGSPGGSTARIGCTSIVSGCGFGGV